MSSESTAMADRLSPESFTRLAHVISTELGIKMPESKLPLVQSRLLRRVRELRLASLEDYCEYLFHSPSAGEERIHFVNAITTNKTDFFREPSHFDYLVGTALPSLVPKEGRPGRRVAVWSAGCSSGEEPYTLAMVLSEYTRQARGLDFVILATDVSTRVLEHARAGVYQAALIAPVPVDLRRRYLLENRKAQPPLVRIAPELRRKVSFHRLNFMDDSYAVADRFDAIFFRNVMIYFDRPTQEAVVRKLCANLVPGGYLFTGHSESAAGMDLPVACVGPSVFRKGK